MILADPAAPGIAPQGPRRILFWGTPDFAVPSLLGLEEEGFEVVGVVTQPDRPAGRGRSLTPSDVKRTAEDMRIPVLTPDRPRGPDFLESIRALRPDLSVVVAYGHILSREVLDVPTMGSINVHASLLPDLRGAAPITWAVARGHTLTGVTIMRMAEEMDAGPVIYQVAEPILDGESASDLWVRLSEVGAAALIETLTFMSMGEIDEEEQEHERASYAPKVDREVARIDWSRPAQEVGWHVRGMDAVPGAWTTLDGLPVKLFRPEQAPTDDLEADSSAEPGTVLAADAQHGLVVATAEGALAFCEVQPPGKRRMAADAWINGRGVSRGQRFE